MAAVLLLPVMPRSAAEILRRVGEPSGVDRIRLADAAWRNHGERRIVKADALWPRVDGDRRPTDEPRANIGRGPTLRPRQSRRP